MKKQKKKVFFVGSTIMAFLLVFTLFTSGCTGKAESDEFYNQGIYYNNHDNQFDKALGYFNKSLELDPGNAQTWFAKSIALYNLKRYDESLASLNTTLAIDPGYSAAWFQKGEVLRILERGNESESCLARAKELGYS